VTSSRKLINSGKTVEVNLNGNAPLVGEPFENFELSPFFQKFGAVE
jgi:hypothetical protein